MIESNGINTYSNNDVLDRKVALASETLGSVRPCASRLLTRGDRNDYSNAYIIAT